jgi:small nuclear ribonucleoprotein (snRNP)-like protein
MNRGSRRLIPHLFSTRRNYFRAALFLPEEVRFPRRTKMNSLCRTLSKCVATLLVCALLAPSMACAAPKPLTPDKAHARILKLGLGNWVGVRLQSGVAFSGKIISIDEQSFSLQRYGDTEATPVAYSDIFDLQMGMPMARSSRNPLTPEVVHARILKLGMGNWAGVQLQNGIAFSGRIVSIDENSFGLQLYGDPEITPVAYSDVVYLQTGMTVKGFWILTGVGFATVTTAAIVGFHEVHSQQQQMPTLPTQPVTPIY